VGLCLLRLLLDRLGGFCGLLLLRGGELPHGHGLLHDYLVFAAVLVSKIGHFVPELGYECVVVIVYPFVYPTVYPVVHVDVHPPVLIFVVLERATGDAFTNGPLRNTEPAGRFLDGKTIYPASIPFVHMEDTRPLGAGTKALRAKPQLDVLKLGSK
jgi:hypothetical protein